MTFDFLKYFNFIYSYLFFDATALDDFTTNSCICQLMCRRRHSNYSSIFAQHHFKRHVLSNAQIVFDAFRAWLEKLSVKLSPVFTPQLFWFLMNVIKGPPSLRDVIYEWHLEAFISKLQVRHSKPGFVQFFHFFFFDWKIIEHDKKYFF